MTGIQERRSFPRVVYFTEALLEGMDAGRTDVRITDISPAGVFVDTREVVPIGTVTRLVFPLGARRFDVKVQVRYAIPSIGMGLAFTDLSADDKLAIETFVANQAHAG